MWTWILKPRNLLLAILTALLITSIGSSLWWRGTSAISAAKAEKAELQARELTAQIEEFQRDVVLIKAHQGRMQAIEKRGAEIQAKVDALPTKDRGLTDEEMAIDRAIVDRLNGVLPGKDGSASKILPSADKAVP
ncbi:MAG: hypothetical protein WC455_29900 [Dehalococcoidia bacterium]|jgi:outer membrane murein-binding lipoprotein Lpp